MNSTAECHGGDHDTENTVGESKCVVSVAKGDANGRRSNLTQNCTNIEKFSSMAEPGGRLLYPSNLLSPYRVSAEKKRLVRQLQNGELDLTESGRLWCRRSEGSSWKDLYHNFLRVLRARHD